MKKENKKILIATGGTGGHIFPSLSLADFLKTKHRVEIVTDKRGLKYLSKQAGCLSDAMFNADPMQSNRSRNWFEIDWLLYNV